MAVTDQNLYNEIQYHLLETPNNGASYGSGLYTAAEVVGRTNYRLNIFNKLTGIRCSYLQTQTVTANAKAQDISTAAPDLIDLLEVAYTPSGGTSTILPTGSSYGGDVYLTTQTPTASPSFYTIDTSKVLNINLFPAPSNVGSLAITYIPKIGTLPATPDGTTITLPDDFTPFIKYGVLADLFGKTGETYDPTRATICESLFQLGVEIAGSWLSGSTFGSN